MSASEPTTGGAAEPRRWGVAWVIGASSGIGAALVRHLEPEAKDIVASARSAAALAELAAAQSNVTALPLDVTDAKGCRGAFAGIEREHGPVDLVVLSVAAWKMMAVEALDPAAIRTGVEVNYLGVINVLDPVLPAMLERGRGHIAIIASVAGFRGLPNSVAYGPTKAALINLAETLRTELGPRGITVSLINPGFVETPLTAGNPFPMPGLVTADYAAEKILDGLKRGRFEILFPFGFGMAMKLLRILPNWLFFRIVWRFIHRPDRKRPPVRP